MIPTTDTDPMAEDRRFASLAVFTDLDGTLLDHDTYAWEPAAEALDQCRRLGVPVIMVSSKTRAEMEVLREELRLDWPFVSENGGGIAFPPSCRPAPPVEAVPFGKGRVWPLGVRYEEVVRAFREIREDLGLGSLRGFSDMTVEEIRRHTGLSEEGARLASQREYDEPIVAEGLTDRERNGLIRAAEERGLQMAAGGRFLHLFGSCDKGVAVSRITAWLRAWRPGLRTMGLGDSPNDLPMLRKVDTPVLIRSSRSVTEMIRAIPGIRVTEETGPAAWNRAVMDVLSFQ